ncbi:MAG: hypothetical protein CMJ64_19640 [Planctomycetaceae bacterium]|nr:hypothetical protein [Planctomycetaceae bacterium]
MSKVWITGVGAVTPLGNGLLVFAANALAGKSGIGSIAFAGKPSERQYIAGFRGGSSRASG